MGLEIESEIRMAYMVLIDSALVRMTHHSKVVHDYEAFGGIINI